jgi:predicted nucleic acid-binding protein
LTATLVDSNVLIDVIHLDPRWEPWSSSQIAAAATLGPLIINQLIFAEISIFFKQPAEIDAAVPPDRFEREHLPWEAAFLAGKCHLLHRRLGGGRSKPPTDFYIGAHAAVAGYRVLTRDPAPYRAYFTNLEVIAP